MSSMKRSFSDKLFGRASKGALDEFKRMHGAAELYSHQNDDMSGLDHPYGGNYVVLGDKLNWVLPASATQGHGITFGATRSGKGVSCIIPALLTYGGSMVVIDPKGENAWATAERRRTVMGHRVVILDPWGEVNRRYGSKASPPVVEQTTRFNPLSFIDPSSEDFADDVGAIADALVIPGNGTDSHWTDSAKELISGLIAARVQLEPGRATLGSVRKAITSDDADLASLASAIIAKDPDSLAARKLRRFANAKDSKEITSIRSTAETQTAILDSRRLIESMVSEPQPFNLDELGSQGQKVTLYLVLPLDRLQTHGRWLRLILTMAIRAIAKQEMQPPVPVLFMLDEMGTVGSLRMVEQAYGLMSGVGIRIWAFLQDLKQLQRDYPESWETFIANASVIQALKVADKTTSDYLSDLIGQTTYSQWVGVDAAKALPDKLTARPVLLPQEIRSFNRNKSIVHMPGIGTYSPLRVPYYGPNSPWKGMYRSPPWFDQAAASPPPQAPSKRRGLFG